MGDHDFDAPVDRRGTGSIKWDRYAGRDVLPMWVADMDFRSPDAVVRALRERADHGVFGYPSPPSALGAAVADHLLADFGWPVDPDWLLWLPGLVSGLNVACRAAGEPGDEVLVMTPVYPPFFTAPTHMGLRTVAVPLKPRGDSWTMDLAALEAAVTRRTRMVLLCNPHNPVGRVFDRTELAALADLCRRRDLLLCSDEIHCGLVLGRDKTHIPAAAGDPEAASRTITLMAPSKTYNIPGLGCAFAVVPEPGLRARFRRAMAGIVPEVNLMGQAAALAAYREGGPWLAELLDYLRGNRDRLAQAVEGMEGLRMGPVEATYLAWIDVRGSGIDAPAAFFEAAGVGLSDGRPFGGEGFLRLNFGCPKAVLETAVERMRTALASR
jgi:cystathionine beta-lyase